MGLRTPKCCPSDSDEFTVLKNIGREFVICSQSIRLSARTSVIDIDLNSIFQEPVGRFSGVRSHLLLNRLQKTPNFFYRLTQLNLRHKVGMLSYSIINITIKHRKAAREEN